MESRPLKAAPMTWRARAPNALPANTNAGSGCQRDFVQVQDVERNGYLGLVLGRYCNTNRPPAALSSSWNRLLVQFSSDPVDVRTGFLAKYVTVQYTSTAGNDWQNNHPGTASLWYIVNIEPNQIVFVTLCLSSNSMFLNSEENLGCNCRTYILDICNIAKMNYFYYLC